MQHRRGRTLIHNHRLSRSEEVCCHTCLNFRMDTALQGVQTSIPATPEHLEGVPYLLSKEL